MDFNVNIILLIKSKKISNGVVFFCQSLILLGLTNQNLLDVKCLSKRSSSSLYLEVS